MPWLRPIQGGLILQADPVRALRGNPYMGDPQTPGRSICDTVGEPADRRSRLVVGARGPSAQQRSARSWPATLASELVASSRSVPARAPAEAHSCAVRDPCRGSAGASGPFQMGLNAADGDPARRISRLLMAELVNGLLCIDRYKTFRPEAECSSSSTWPADRI
jgi:hypothetical protein